MGNMTMATLFVMFMNIFMFLGQATVIALTPEVTSDQPITIYNCSGSIIESVSALKNCNYLGIVDDKNFVNELPVAQKEVDKTSGLGFLDLVTTSKKWITDKATYFINVLSAPYNILKMIPNIPPLFVFAIGTLWYGITFFLLGSFILGRE